ncbi:DEAH-box ATP-dependent RNA helicase prp22 [Madurella fahalii]|uniref:RNA helicase n=1 Tax=Madurella fahalii TaxID=1157608 RepID=A0ABQ0GDJ0_9PEZI
MIGITQPRRVAAMSVAKRVAGEVGCPLGHEVGYSIRFDDCTSPSTQIKYMTDGMLQREILADPYLKRYSVIMLDEAHERTIATDVLFALLKKAMVRRPSLKVIATSATLDAERFSVYFNRCPILTIPGRTYPVQILYSKDPESDYIEAAVNTALEVHLAEDSGDILVFLTGQDEIDMACTVLNERVKAFGHTIPELIVLPIYSTLPPEKQTRIFEPTPRGSRKVIIATNIAETSITIDGICFVIDSGFVKQNVFDPKLGMESLVVTPISQAQANQRAGRAGRTAPGKCFRLYTEAAYQSEMIPTTVPEIQRTNMANTALLLKAMGINNIPAFPFMDPPSTGAVHSALHLLFDLGALDDEGLLTSLGRRMADFPVDPPLARALIASAEKGCSAEMLSITAMLSVSTTVFHRPQDEKQRSRADARKARFHDPTSDHLTLLNLHAVWSGTPSTSRGRFCSENFVNERAMHQADHIREQLANLLTQHGYPIISYSSSSSLPPSLSSTEPIRRALCAGFCRNVARRSSDQDPGSFKTLTDGSTVFLHPSSALISPTRRGQQSADLVVYHSVVATSKEYMHCATSIKAEWLLEETRGLYKCKKAEAASASGRKVGGYVREEGIRPLAGRDTKGDEWRLSHRMRQSRRRGGATWG